MRQFLIKKDPNTQETWIETPLKGNDLLINPLLNKDTAFTLEERESLGLLGNLPCAIEILEEQLARSYLQFRKYATPIQQYIYLQNLHDKNEILFYKLLSEHITEMLPIIYTPVVGEAVKEFIYEYRYPRGLFLNYRDENKLEEIIKQNIHPEISIVLVTDGERILGMGDQGVAGMPIPIAKLTLYTLCGGINPYNTLPILLDIGTNNSDLLTHPLYLGWRHERIQGAAYDQFVEKFVFALKKHLPNVLLHWEDFGRENARRLLEKYRTQICSFNDDMQGTGMVTLAALLSAVYRKKEKISQQVIAILGAGTAGVGIADQVVRAMMRENLSKEEAIKRIWLIDKEGLLSDAMNLVSFQKPYARSQGGLSLEAVVKLAKPTILIGCSSVSGAFNETIVKSMMQYCERPIIFPLSNPNALSEADPKDLLNWTNGKALVATGSPFKTKVAQCNNALVFPGVGLGIMVSKAKQITDNMLSAACLALADFAAKNSDDLLLPPLHQAKQVAVKVASAIVEAALKEKVTDLKEPEDILTLVQKSMWFPAYSSIRSSD